ncbi:hypothetical protein ACFUIZ_33905 [Streptomyces cinereoruber]|uniref:hypothetical protein n=1 Tax=Streptomyces cinereoruber TaxID=67260 RepID=UPI00363F2BB0
MDDDVWGTGRTAADTLVAAARRGLTTGSRIAPRPQGRSSTDGSSVEVRRPPGGAVGALAETVEEIISSHADDHYSNGWNAPRQRINWTHYIFYDADIRVSALDWFMNRLREIARIPASDDDGDLIRGTVPCRPRSRWNN